MRRHRARLRCVKCLARSCARASSGLRRSAAHLLRLVNEVFDLATVDAGQMRLDRDQYPVDEAIEDALAIGRGNQVNKPAWAANRRKKRD